MKNRLIFLLGILSLGVGWLGVFLPLLPATPFFLMSATCFYRSSPRMHRWLMRQKIVGEYIKNYENKQMARRDKQVTLVILWAGILLSVYLVDLLPLKLLLIAIACGVTWHLLTLKSV